ncbi:MAG: S8/S53 family peptidase [Planctomycetes bacterium]|nr:S8/S53 family peptidase [Planctomycetota bacterium]
MNHFHVQAAWEKYGDVLTWGRGQCLAILDDGCDLTVPEWRVEMPWGKKVVAGYDSIDHDDDPTPVPPGYHGTSVGYPSSLNLNGVRGVAFNNSVAHVRAITIVHLRRDESVTLADGLQWVIDHHRRYNITAVNLSPVDDVAHREPVPTAIDAKLAELRALDIWVSAPCGNNSYTNGISWPACQPGCFAIGAAKPGCEEAICDRWSNTDILVPATATSSSNAYAVGSAMVLREAIQKAGYDTKQDAPNLPDAMMAIFLRTGVEVRDPASGQTFKRLDLLAALDDVFTRGSARDGRGPKADRSFQ